MDELKVRSQFLKGIIQTIIKKAIKKSLGIDIQLMLGDFSVGIKDGKILATVDAAIEAKTDDISKVLKDMEVI